MSTATGWAVLAYNGRILVKTVSETRRAAIINYLVTEKDVVVTRDHTDEDIEKMWRGHGQYVSCGTVVITYQNVPL